MTQEINNQLMQESESFLKKYELFTVDTNEDVKEAENAINSISKLKKDIKETFDPIVKKAYEVHKEATNQRKKFLTPLEKAETILKENIKLFLNITKNDEGIKPEVNKKRFKPKWKYNIIDFSKIPTEYLMVDEKKLIDFITRTDGKKNIEGIEAYQEY